MDCSRCVSFRASHGHVRPVRCAAQATPQASSSGRRSAADLREGPAAWPNVKEGYWSWKGHKIRYQRSGDKGPAVLMVHGFGANADHWRKNTPVVGEWGRAYAIDLLGYGYSDKPAPDKDNPNTIYNHENWAAQLEAFSDEVIGDKVTLVANSVGGLACLVFAREAASKVHAVQLYNVSLRMLHNENQSALQRPFTKAFQNFLRKSSIGATFFDRLATPKAVKNVLSQAYCDASTVTDELVECVLKPGKEPGAVAVFLDFISYSTGPLPGPSIAECPVPVGIVWGAEDPWEKVEWGRDLAKQGGIDDYTELSGVGHCPQDEAPQLVNPLIRKFVEKHAK